VGGRAREPGRGQIHLARQVAEGIVVLRDARGAEGVGLDDVGPGREVALVDVADHVGPRQAEQLAVVFQVLGVILEALPAVVALGQPEPLDHRAHCAVENRDALREQARQGLATGVDDRFHDHCIVGSGNVPAFFPGTIRAILPSSAPAPGSILHEVFGYEQFRGPQAAIVNHVIAGGDALVLMPTGGGKSLCYQIPAIARQRAGLGVTVVVSPLIALMHDQVGALHEAGVEAQFLNSSLSVEEANAVERRMLRGDLTLLYAAPERVTTPRFLAQLDSLHERGKLSLFAIDEAHCVSQWGHDFRPEYRALTVLHERYVSVPRIALTATADAITRADILERLQLGQARQFISSFDRPNIHYTIVEKNDATAQLLRFIEADHEGAAGIVYCQTRKRVEEIAQTLCRHGIAALPYHAGLDSETRQANQDRFLRDDGIVMVATIAFGMGIDKPDVRFVAHLDMPKNIEGYYQETGRAGRDGLPAAAWMAYGLQDVVNQRRMIDESPAGE